MVEIVAGYLTGSMALLADGFHMATHAGALGVAASAYSYFKRHASSRAYSYGTGKVGDRSGSRRRWCVLRRPVESAQYTSEQFQRLMADNRVTCSMSRSGNVWDNAAMESFFSSLKTERTARKTYRTRNQARQDVLE